MPIKLPETSTVTFNSLNNRRSIVSILLFTLLLSTWYFLPINKVSNNNKIPPFQKHKPSPPLEPILFPTPENYQHLVRPISLENATSIFNTINSALKPKHSQLLPNGVSFIPAYIPQGSLLYHGNVNGEIPQSLEWIALDHEFSFSFISHRGGPGFNHTFPGSGPGGPPVHKRPDDKGPPEHGPPSHWFEGKPDQKHSAPPGGPGGPGGPPPPPPGGPPPRDHKHPGGGIGPGGPGNDHEWKSNKDHSSMLTFQVVKPLDRMILLDGSSAAKSMTGEMDTQMILAHVDNNETIGEYEAAQRICKWGKQFGIDGYIRIEVGFEAVICNFHSDKLRLISNVTLDWSQEALGFPLESDKIEDKAQEILDEIGAVAGYDQIKQGNVHDKRDRRVLLDYRGLTTPLNKTWVNPDPYLRRINNISEGLKDHLIQDLEVFMSRGVDPYAGTDWQLVTDEIVDKFAPILKKLNDSLEFINSHATSEELLQAAANLTIYTSNFVRRFTDHNIKDENAKIELAKKQAVFQYSHPLQDLQSESDVMIWSSITKITIEIVDIIFEISKQSKKILSAGYVEKTSVEKYNNALLAAQKNLSKLLTTLNWSIYYQCDQVCGWDEVCYTPSWGPNPLGWGNTGFGTVLKEGESRARVANPLQCISYRTILEQRARR